MRFGLLRRNGIGEAHVAIGAVTVHKSAGNGVNNSERSCVGRAVGFDAAAEDFDRRRGRQFFPGDGGVRREGEGKLHTVAGLVSGEIPDRDGNRRRRRNGLAGSAAASRKQENGKKKNAEELLGAFCDVKCRPFSIFHFQVSRIRECSGSDPGS